jgi:hypothetical protein
MGSAAGTFWPGTEFYRCGLPRRGVSVRPVIYTLDVCKGGAFPVIFPGLSCEWIVGMIAKFVLAKVD